MFTFIESGYQLFRSRGRTILLICISALLCGVLAVYMNNISATRLALERLSSTTPVMVRIVNADGSAYDNLDIDAELADHLLDAGLRDIRITRAGNAAYDPALKGQEDFLGGDCTIMAVNCPEAAYLETSGERDLGFLSGSEGLCLVDESFAQENGIAAGDTVSLELYMTTAGGRVFLKLSDDAQLKVAGICGPEEGTGATFYLPLAWMRAACDASEKGYFFQYSSFNGIIKEPLKLNEFKASLRPMGFYQPFGASMNHSLGNAISVEDEMFIKTARRLGENLKMFQQYLLAFCVAVAGLVTLVIFLTLRGARRDMAVALSLGRPKPLIGLAHLLALLAAQLAGAILAMPVMAVAGLGWSAVTIALCFLACAIVGDICGLAMALRFDAMQLLLAEK